MTNKTEYGRTVCQRRYDELECIVDGKTLQEALIETIIMAEYIQDDVIYRFNKLEAKFEALIDMMVRMNKLKDGNHDE